MKKLYCKGDEMVDAVDRSLHPGTRQVDHCQQGECQGHDYHCGILVIDEIGV